MGRETCRRLLGLRINGLLMPDQQCQKLLALESRRFQAIKIAHQGVTS
jgi:hypothetical protein